MIYDFSNSQNIPTYQAKTKKISEEFKKPEDRFEVTGLTKKVEDTDLDSYMAQLES